MEFVLFLSSRLPDPEKIKEFKEPLREWEVGDNLFRRSLIFNFFVFKVTESSTFVPGWSQDFKDLLPEEEVQVFC